MADLESTLRQGQEAVRSFLARARAVAQDRWATPRAPGKWCCGQVAEHVALSYEKGCATLRGEPGSQGMPRWARPLLRWLYLNKILKSGKFPAGSKAPKEFEPAPSPAPLAATLARVEKAAADFAETARRVAREAGAMIDHPVFGRIGITDYVRLNDLHTRHHEQQLV